MSAIASMTLNDGQATPAAHTFGVVNVDAAGIAKWVDRASGIALGFPQITLSLRQPTKGSRNYKLMAKILVPTLEVTSPSTSTGIQPAPTLAYNHLATIEMIMPERGSALERANALAYLKNFLAHANFTNAVSILEPVW